MKFRHAIKVIEAPANDLEQFCIKLSRNTLRQLVGILSGRLNKHMRRIGVAENPTSRTCGQLNIFSDLFQLSFQLDLRYRGILARHGTLQSASSSTICPKVEIA